MNKSSSSPKLMSLDIDKLVKDAKSQPLPSSEEVSSSPSTQDHWENFLYYLNEFKGQRTSRNRKKTFYIEDNIVAVIESCNINNSSITNIINAALRSFVEQHKQELRSCLRPNPTLIED